MSRPVPCPACPRLHACVKNHDEACADLRRWRDGEPATLAALWAEVLPGEPGEQVCG